MAHKTDATTLTKMLEEERDGLSKDIYGLFQIVDCMTRALQTIAEHALDEEEPADWLYELVAEIHQTRCKIQGNLDQFVTAYEEEESRISPS